MEAKRTPSLYRKRDGKWYCTLWGRQRYLGKDLEVARAKLAAIMSVGEDRPAETLGDISRGYLASLRWDQSGDTIETKGIVYRAFLAFAGNKTGIRSVTAETIERYKRHCFTRGLHRQTVRNKLLSLSALFEYAVREKRIKANPVKQVPGVSVAIDPVPDFLTEEEAAKLLVLTEGQRYRWLGRRDRLLFVVMLHAGLRRKEATNLTWPDIDFVRRILVVRGGKGGKSRIVGLSNTLLAALQDCWENWKRNDLYVITTRSGGRIVRNSLSHAARKYIERLNHQYRGKRRFTLHSLRATFATRLCERGVSTRTVQALLGHSDPRTTMRYMAASETAILDAAKRLG